MSPMSDEPEEPEQRRASLAQDRGVRVLPH